MRDLSDLKRSPEMKRLIAVLLCAGILGCTAPRATVDDSKVRAAIAQHIENPDAKVAGPRKKIEEEELALFSATARSDIQRLLKSGAVAYIVLVPDFSQIVHGPNGLIEIDKIDRVILTRDEQIVADIPSDKANQSTQPTSLTRRG